MFKQDTSTARLQFELGHKTLGLCNLEIVECFDVVDPTDARPGRKKKKRSRDIKHKLGKVASKIHTQRERGNEGRYGEDKQACAEKKVNNGLPCRK